ncbi:MAG: hypothetical protein NUV34_03740, partial [Sulfuricaulis sp.]|nr:hypothetical protein [Sulfuricaulis sp.]
TIPEDAPADKVAEMLDWILCLGATVRDAKKQFDEQIISWIQANGDLTIGDKRYYVGPEKTTKSIDNARTLEALLTATDGDVQAIAGLLSSQPYKHGSCRGVLGDQWDKCFIVEEKLDLKTGVAKKELLVFDPTFTKKGLPCNTPSN